MPLHAESYATSQAAVSTAALGANATQQARASRCVQDNMPSTCLCLVLLDQVADDLAATTMGSLLGALSPASNQTNAANQTSVQKAWHRLCFGGELHTENCRVPKNAEGFWWKTKKLGDSLTIWHAMLRQAIAAGASAAAVAASLGMTTEQQITAAAQAAMTSGQHALDQDA